MSARSSLRAGLTLIEVVIAIAILGMMTTITWQVLSGTIATRDALAYDDEVQEGAQVALRKISRELELAFLTKNKTAVNTYRTVFVAEDASGLAQMWFATQAHQRLYRNARECDQAEVTIWAEPDPNHDGAYVLLHRESQRIDEKPDEDGVIQPLAYNVRNLLVRFLDGETCMWEDTWDSNGEQLDRLPRAAQIMLVLYAPDPEDPEKVVERAFATTVILQYAKQAKCELFANANSEEETTE